MDIQIFFDEVKHKYTDNRGNVFTSVTTAIGKYVEKFDAEGMAAVCAKIGKNPNHPKYLKYKGKTKQQLLAEWKATTQVALDRGNEKHNYLEAAVKHSNGYKLVEGKFIRDRIFTIPDIVKNPKVGQVSLSRLRELKLNVNYPSIYKVIENFVDNGWKLYAEIGTFNIDLLISGLVDLLLVRDNKFIILDWKTNKAPIQFISGYYEKDVNGNLTNNYIRDNKFLQYPLNYIPASSGHKYTLQLSGYAYLIEYFGLELETIILCHIRQEEGKEETVEFLPIKYLKEDIHKLFTHHSVNSKRVNELVF